MSRSVDVMSTSSTDEIVKKFHQLFQGTETTGRDDTGSTTGTTGTVVFAFDADMGDNHRHGCDG